MPQFIPNLHRILFSSSSTTTTTTSLLFRRRTLISPFITCLSPNNNNKSLNQTFRKITTRKNKVEKLAMVVEEDTARDVGFNKRRAEGRDKNDRPKELKLKSRRLNPVNTLCYFQVLGTGMDTQDTSPSVLLFFDKQRFIFNAGEGLQRFCTEHKIKLSKIDRIFLSRVCSETAGGLPGLLLTLAGIGEEGMSVKVCGPSDFKYLVDAMKSFIPNAAMVHTQCFGTSDGDTIDLVDDEVVKISAVILGKSSLKEYGPEETSREENKMDESPKRLVHQNADLPTKPGDISVIYICELPEIRGKFDPEKAKALGLRPGPKFRELQLGNSVKSDRENVMIHPSDVMGPSVAGPIVLLVDCPTTSHLQEVASLQSLRHYYADVDANEECCSKTVNCVIHLSPASVVKTVDYQKWMSRFGGAKHILAGHQINNIEVPILKSSARIAARLNYLCPQFFPAPGFWSLQQSTSSASTLLSNEGDPVSDLCESISAENLLKFNLRPYAHLGLDRSSIPASSSPQEIIDDLILEIPEIVDSAQQVARLWQEDRYTTDEMASEENALPSCLEDITREDAEIVLLGTGSSQPSKYRNVSSIFINLFSKGSLLFDCGEGTLGQLKRRFGIEGADDAVRGLRCIWISHIHADHHTGLARLLALRRDLLKGLPHEPLIVIGPRQLKRYINAYEKLEDLDMQFLDCSDTTEASLAAFEANYGSPTDFENSSTLFGKGNQMESIWKKPSGPVEKNPIMKNLKDVLGKAGLEALVSFPVVHCPQAFGVVLKAAARVNSIGKIIPGWKIVYSGDTRPCPELVRASHGATVLIHEATFEDGMLDEAMARNHSTTKEAIEVGNSAGAYRIILTHFSQRYPKIPVFDEAHMHKTCIAFDMMSVNLADIHILPRVLPYLKVLFKNEMTVDESDDVISEVTAD